MTIPSRRTAVSCVPSSPAIDLLNRLRTEGFSVSSGFVTSEGASQMRLAESAAALFLIAEPSTAEGFSDALEPVLGCGQP